MSKSGPATIRVRGRGRRTVELTDATLDVFDDFDGSMSTRQVFYQLVSRGAIENRPADYGRVQRLLVELRRTGAISYDRVVDRTRSKHQRPGWAGVEALMGACASQYRRNLWLDQDTTVMIGCEKQALEGIFAEAVDPYGASLWVFRGYVSESFAYEWATEIQEINDRGGAVVVGYFGDHDPSGIDIDRDCQEKLERHGADFDWYRWGLLQDDFDKYDLVNVPVKASDSRARAYLKKYGNRAAELDALPPDVLRDRIKIAIEHHIDHDALERVQQAEAVERESIQMVRMNWDRAVAAVSTSA